MDEETVNNMTRIGEELNQLSRFLFDEAANKWYLALILQVVAGLAATVLGVLSLTGDAALGAIMVVVIVTITAGVLRHFASDQYDAAEAMRRQSVLNEAIGRSITQTQMATWRQKAGKRLWDKVMAQPREADYYATQQMIGLQRLAEMTIESAFYTRHVYGKLRARMWDIVLSAGAATLLIVTGALASSVPNRIQLIVARVICSLIPVALAIDLFGWALKLAKLMTGIEDVEAGLEQELRGKRPELQNILCWIDEYNCQVKSGMPIHNWLFRQWHDEIKELWEHR